MTETPDLTDLLLRVQPDTVAAITARMVADMTAGVDPRDPAYDDVSPGGWTHDILRCTALELNRQDDRAIEMAAQCTPATASGVYLDAWAASYRLERTDASFAGGVVRFAGEAATVVPTGLRIATVQTSPDTDPVTYEVMAGGVIGVSGELDLDVIAMRSGARGNVPAGTVTQLISPLEGVTVTNPTAMTSGADVQDDERLRVRVLRRQSGTGGGGNVAWFEEKALAYPGIGFVTVEANWAGRGTVRLIVTDLANDPVARHVLDGLKAQLDPEPEGEGGGEATIGAAVTVITPTSARVDAEAEVVLAAGYTLDGAGGTRAAGPAIRIALGLYVDRLPPGGDVVWVKALAAITAVPGVVDVPDLQLNGARANVAIDGDEVAQLGDVTLTEAA